MRYSRSEETTRYRNTQSAVPTWRRLPMRASKPEISSAKL